MRRTGGSRVESRHDDAAEPARRKPKSGEERREDSQGMPTSARRIVHAWQPVWSPAFRRRGAANADRLKTGLRTCGASSGCQVRSRHETHVTRSRRREEADPPASVSPPRFRWGGSTCGGEIRLVPSAATRSWIGSRIREARKATTLGIHTSARRSVHAWQPVWSTAFRRRGAANADRLKTGLRTCGASSGCQVRSRHAPVQRFSSRRWCPSPC